jgi:hypothetical protein
MMSSFLDDAEKHFARARYFTEQGEHTQAAEEFAKALTDFRHYLGYVDRNPTTEVFLSSNRGEFLKQLVQLYKMGVRYYIHLGDENKLFFILNEYRVAFKAWSSFQNSFDVEDLEEHRSIGQDINNYLTLMRDELETNAEDYLQAIENIAKSPDGFDKIDNGDEIFKKTRLEFQKIASLNICRFSQANRYSTSDSSCFIATAAYNTFTHPDLDTFRSFRDKRLRKSLLGNLLINVYYKVGPSIASYVKTKELIRKPLKENLALLAQWMRKQKIVD